MPASLRRAGGFAAARVWSLATGLRPSEVAVQADSSPRLCCRPIKSLNGRDLPLAFARRRPDARSVSKKQRWSGGDGEAQRLEDATEAHFADPIYYTASYRERVEDIDYYLAEAVQHERVLEYGCGNGRIALPIAYSGVAITGVDRSAPMLRDFRKRLKHASAAVRDRVSVRRGDMRSLKLSKPAPRASQAKPRRDQFSLVICTFNTFLHLYTRRDVERFCARVREHLTPRGRFVVDVDLPSGEEMSRDPKRLYRCRPFRHASRGEVVRYGERFRYQPLAQIMDVEIEFELRDDPKERWTMPLAHRMFFPQELEALLHYNGLELREVHGDFERNAPTAESQSLIYHCRKRRGFP